MKKLSCKLLWLHIAFTLLSRRTNMPLANAVLLLRLGYGTVLLFLAGWATVAGVKFTALLASPSSGVAVPLHSLLLSPDNKTGTTDRSSRLRSDVSKDITNRTRPFEWSYVDINRTAACGMRKCFFHSSASPKDDNVDRTGAKKEGYLVAKHCEKDEKYDYLDRMMRTWIVAQSLQQRHTLRHFMLEPPQKISAPSLDELDRLNSVAKRGGKSILNGFYGNGTKEYSLIIQKVREAPSPSLIPRCYFAPKGRGGRFFFDSNSGSKKEFDGLVSNKTEFMATFQYELQELFELLKEEQRLWNDFQFLVDVYGRIHHIDLDRIEQSGYSAPTKNAFDNCFGSVIRNIMRILFEGDYSEIKKKKRKKGKKKVKTKIGR